MDRAALARLPYLATLPATRSETPTVSVLGEGHARLLPELIALMGTVPSQAFRRVAHQRGAATFPAGLPPRREAARPTVPRAASGVADGEPGSHHPRSVGAAPTVATSRWVAASARRDSTARVDPLRGNDDRAVGSAAPRYLSTGDVVGGRYRVCRTLGEGGMGVVYLVEHLKLARPFALKLMHPTAETEATAVDRFAREAISSARLEDARVARAIDYGQTETGRAYLVMPWIRGRTLRRYLEGGEVFDWRRASEIAAQIADTLVEMHRAALVHRDIKPSNIMVEVLAGGADRVTLLDLGAVHVLPVAAPSLAAANLTLQGTFVGTPGYVAPEQAIDGRVSTAADVYSLGVVLWELIVGRRPFADGEVAQLVTRQLCETIPPLTTASGDVTVPLELDRLVRAMLSPRSENRPASAAEVARALRALLNVDAARPTPRSAWSEDRPFIPRESASRSGAAVAAAATFAPGLDCGASDDPPWELALRLFPLLLGGMAVRALFSLVALTAIALVLAGAPEDGKSALDGPPAQGAIVAGTELLAPRARGWAKKAGVSADRYGVDRGETPVANDWRKRGEP